MSGTLLAIALGTAQQAAAAPTTPPAPPAPASQTPSATRMTKKNIQIPSPQTSPRESGKIERVGNMSSRPWTTIVGWHPGASAFVTGETAEPQLVLFRVNF